MHHDLSGGLAPLRSPKLKIRRKMAVKYRGSDFCHRYDREEPADGA
jgi:hypothetical protein